MQDFEALGKRFMSGAQAEKLKAAAASPEGKKLANMLDAKVVEEAAKKGDTETLGNILRSVLATDEGKRLAAQLSDAMGKKR